MKIVIFIAANLIAETVIDLYWLNITGNEVSSFQTINDITKVHNAIVLMR